MRLSRFIVHALAVGAMPCAAFGAAPIPGVDLNPFGCQTVWPSDGRLPTFNQRIHDAGVQWARFEIMWWSLCEKDPGVYDFTSPDFPGWESWNADAAVADLHARGIEPFCILNYGNSLYDNQNGPFTDAGRTGFGNYAHAAALRYKDTVQYWEIWNEPNLAQFWSPAPNAQNYARLVAAAAPRIRAANPNAKIVGGVTSGIDQAFLETAFQNGLLDNIDVLTIHPYRINTPESIGTEVATLRTRMANYTTRTIPIWTGEWGYNTAWSEITPLGQAKCLSRMMVNNLAIGIQNSIWFSIHPFQEAGDGTDPEWSLLDLNLNPRESFYAFRTVNQHLAAPVEAVADPFAISHSPTASNFRSAVFRRESDKHYVVALWQANWPVPDSYAGRVTTVRLNAPPTTTAYHAYDGLTGNEVALSIGNSSGATTINNIRLWDYPTFIEVQLAPDIPGDVDGDGTLTPTDAQAAFECYLNGACPAGSSAQKANFCTDAQVTPSDAQAIFQTWLGLANPCP